MFAYLGADLSLLLGLDSEPRRWRLKRLSYVVTARFLFLYGLFVLVLLLVGERDLARTVGASDVS